MSTRPMSHVVSGRLQTAAKQIGTADPVPYVKPLLDRTFELPEGDPRYARNSLMPGAAPLEPSFSEREPQALRFTLQPLGPQSSPTDRRAEATREMRRLVGSQFGPRALHWFDERSEQWRGMGSRAGLDYGAFFGSGYDGQGLQSSKIYYELTPGQVSGFPHMLDGVVRDTTNLVQGLQPLFTTITCRRRSGHQRATFLHRGPLKLSELQPLCERLGLSHQLPSLMRVLGLTLGGRFELPADSTVVAVGSSDDGPELKVEVLLGRLPDVPESFFQLLQMGLAERPKELRALSRWLQAFSPGDDGWPGNPSVLSVRVSRQRSATVTLYLRPVEFEIHELPQQQPAGSIPSPSLQPALV